MKKFLIYWLTIMEIVVFVSHPKCVENTLFMVSTIGFLIGCWTSLLIDFYNAKIIRHCIGYYNEYGYVIELFVNGYYKETLYVAGNNKHSSAIVDQVEIDNLHCLPLNTIREYCLQTIISICNEHGYENQDIYQKIEIEEVNPKNH